MNSLNPHLSEEALDDILIGAATAGAEAHLASCSSCAARLADFRSSMAMFTQASTAWSQAHSNTISRELVPRRATIGTAAAWSLGTATALAIALAFATGTHRDAPQTAPTATVGKPADPQQEIATDNEILAAIDLELSRPVASPIEVYGIAKPPTPRAAPSQVRE